MDIEDRRLDIKGMCNVYYPEHRLVEKVDESMKNKSYEFDYKERKFKYIITKGVMQCAHCKLEINDIYTHCQYCDSF
jgi:hypothetical protein